MALSLLYTILLLTAVTGVGSVTSFWARKYNIQGLEIWLPLAIILSYGMSPLAGLVVASLIIIISWAMFPYPLQYVLVMIVFLAALCFSTIMVPVTAVSFVKTALILVIVYNVLSNFILAFTGGNIANITKFALLSTVFSWFIFLKIGWWMVVLFR